MKGHYVCLFVWVLEGKKKKEKRKLGISTQEMWLHFYGSILVCVRPMGSIVGKAPGHSPSLDSVLLQQDANQHISSPDVSQRFLEDALSGK